MQVAGKRSHCLQICLLGALALTLSGAAQVQAPPAPAQRFVVVLDAAHGGDDIGGTLSTQAGQPLQEKAFTLALSVRLRSLLGARGITVVTTRESDATVDKDHRAEIANHANAQACLSLHGTQSGTGIHLYTSSLAPAQQTSLIAWKTAQAAWVTRSLGLAGVLNSALTHSGLTVLLGRTALPVIDRMACPAVAVEVAPGPASGSAQPIALDDAGYQAQVAQALAAAILEWKSNGARADAPSAEALQP